MKRVKAHPSWITKIIELPNNHIVSACKEVIKIWSANFEVLNSYLFKEKIYDLIHLEDEKLICRTPHYCFIFNHSTG